MELVLLPIVLVGILFAVAVGFAARHESRRRSGWEDLARRRGMQHAPSDPLGLSAALGGQVARTVSGTVDGVRIAVVGVRFVGGDGPDPVVPVAVAITAPLPAARSARFRLQQHHGLLTLTPPPRMRRVQITPDVREAEALLDELLSVLGSPPPLR